MQQSWPRQQQLFTVMRLDQTYAQMTNQLMASIHLSEAQMMPQETQTPAQKTEQEAFEAKLMTVVMGELSWQKLEPDFATLYAEAYTTEQLDGLIAFYGSPLGQTVLAKTPDLLRQSSVISQQHLTVILPQIQKMVQDEAVEVEGAGWQGSRSRASLNSSASALSVTQVIEKCSVLIAEIGVRQ